ncbi:MAG: flagellar hook assembly protein FlgD [Alphaproteobacteria bacterium]|nr:MAG: flagellar hook assembly protein FlgD [Alphaproteobacteria bacterium]
MTSIASVAAATGPDTGTSSLSQLSSDYTHFLKLLTAQLTNQDPLAPMEGTEFVSQLAQLSQVEQAVKANDGLSNLSSQIAALSMVAGAATIGRSVTVSSSEIEVTADGVETFRYSVPTEAVSVKAEIRDTVSGFLVRTIPDLPVDGSGQQALDWDGKGDTGQKVLPGSYSVTVIAEDESGNRLPVRTERDTTVQEVFFEQGQMYYRVAGGEGIAATAVLSIR